MPAEDEQSSAAPLLPGPGHDPGELRPTGSEPAMGDPAGLESGPLPSGDDPEVEVTSADVPPRRGARFHVFTGALLGVVVVAVFLLGGFLLGGRADPEPEAGPSWSSWKPSKDGAQGAAQIAAHVGPKYRGADGRQLVLTKGGDLELSGVPFTVALRGVASSGGDVRLFEDKGVLYRLCGLGKDCAIATGEPSIERHLLLRRQALELALHSLRYLDGVQQVVVIMPPRQGSQPGQALFFRRSQVSGELEKPLEATLVDRTPTVARVTKSPDALLVEQLTLPTLFRFSLTQAGQDDRAFLVLDPLDSADPAAPAPQPRGSSRSNA